MKYDYNDKKSATATVMMKSGAPWATTVRALSGTATDPNKDITGIRATVAPRTSLGAAVDAAAGAKVTQVETRPVLIPEVLPKGYFPEQWRPLATVPTGLGTLLTPTNLSIAAIAVVALLYFKRK